MIERQTTTNTHRCEGACASMVNGVIILKSRSYC